MKKNKKLKLSLNKQTIAKLDNDALKEIKGGDQEFLSIFHCSYTPKCAGTTDLTVSCGYSCGFCIPTY